MEDWILYGRVEDTGTKKAAFRFLRAEHGLFGKGNRSFVGSSSMSMRGNGEERKGAALFPGNSGELLHQAADGLRVSGGVIHGQALNELCLCVEQGTVLADLVGIASLLGGFQHREDRVVDVQL